MAAPKKTVKPADKLTENTVKAETAGSRTEAPKAEVKASGTEAKEAKKEVKKEETQKTARKSTAKKPAARKTVKKADQKTAVHIQFAGKSYSQEELIKIAQDVWKYDLKQKVRELASIDLYVKPEEDEVYYVMNQEFTGFFNI